MCTDHTLYLPPFLRTHPYLITISQPPTRATHNIFPIRWLGVLKATIKLRSSNLRSRQMDAGFSGRWLRGRPFLLQTSFASRFLSLESLLSATGAKAKRVNLAIQSATIKWRGKAGRGGLFRISSSRRGGERRWCWMLAAARWITWINLDPNLARSNGSVHGGEGFGCLE